MYTANQFVAHRGYQKHYPENSLLAVEKAIAAGAVNIELDVLLSRDGVYMLCHDEHLQRLSGRDGVVSELSACELFTINAHEPERLGNAFDDVFFNALEDLLPVIQNHPHVDFYIELKVEAVVSHQLEYCLCTLRDVLSQVLDQIVLISFDPLSVKHAKSDYGFPRAGIVLIDWPTRNNVIAETCADVAFVNAKRLPEEGAISTDCPLVVYEIADPAIANDLLQRGASKIETYEIGEMLEHFDCQD